MPKKNRRMLLPALLRLFRGKPSVIGPINTLRKILLIKQSERMGNILLMNAGIAGLRKTFPSVQIDLLLPAAYAELMKGNENISNIIPVAKREYIIKPWALAGLLRDIRRRAYDLAINCSDVNSHSSTEAAYTILSRAKVTAGWKAGNGGLFDIEITPYVETLHATKMYTRLFSGIFECHIEGEPYFTGGSGSDNFDYPVIGINCGGRGPKRIPLKQFLTLGGRLAGAGVRVEYILGPDEEQLRSQLESRISQGCRLLPSMDLIELRKTILHYRAFVSSDTGPMHLAWISGIPTIALFIDSEIEKFRPLSPCSLAVDGSKGIDLDVIYRHLQSILNHTKVSQ